MKTKYIEEKYRHYFIFGENPTTGKVDINNGEVDICNVSMEEAEVLIKDRDEILTLINLINSKFPKELEECYKILDI